MTQFLRQKRATIVFAGLISLMIVLMSHDLGNRGGTDVAGELMFKAGAPAVRAGSSVTSLMSGVFRNYIDLRGVRAENQRLQEALLRTERERDGLRDLAMQGTRLQRLLDLKQARDLPAVAARVAGSGFASGQATLLIDRGTADGIRAGMPVIAVGGVVGKVVRVSSALAKVQCLGDPASGVAVVLQESGHQGMVVGHNKEICDLIYVPAYAEVDHGDLVVTSGLDRIYPRGIPVGRVVGVPEGSGVSRKFQVKPGVEFQSISDVLVLQAPLSSSTPEELP